MWTPVSRKLKDTSYAQIKQHSLSVKWLAPQTAMLEENEPHTPLAMADRSEQIEYAQLSLCFKSKYNVLFKRNGLKAVFVTLYGKTGLKN